MIAGKRLGGGDRAHAEPLRREGWLEESAVHCRDIWLVAEGRLGCMELSGDTRQASGTSGKPNFRLYVTAIALFVMHLANLRIVALQVPLTMRRVASTAARRAIHSRVRNYAQQSSSNPPVQITTLPNNVRVATEAAPGHFAGVGLYVDAGSRYETASNSGVSHFLDRMAFKVRVN